MKLKLLSLAIVALVSTSAFSQSFKIGFKGGANINKLSGQSFKENFSFGYQLGGFVELGLGKKFAIQPEVLFNQFKTDTSSTFSSIYPSFNKVKNIKLNYLSIPILLNYNVANILTLQAGPQFGILMDQNKKLLQNGQDAFKSGDFAMLGGVQLKLLKFRIYGRYAIGLTDINNITNSDKWKSQSFQLGVGISL